MCDAVCTIVHNVSVASSEFGLLVTLDLIELCKNHVVEVLKFVTVGIGSSTMSSKESASNDACDAIS